MAGRTLIFLGGGDGICYAFAALTEIPDKPTFLEKVWSYDCNPPPLPALPRRPDDPLLSRGYP